MWRLHSPRLALASLLVLAVAPNASARRYDLVAGTSTPYWSGKNWLPDGNTTFPLDFLPLDGTSVWLRSDSIVDGSYNVDDITVAGNGAPPGGAIMLEPASGTKPVLKLKGVS